MADSSTVCSSGETSVCYDSYAVSESHTVHSACEREHFAHSRAALGAFITNDYYVAGFYCSVIDSLYSGLFLVEYTSRASVCEHLGENACDLADSSVFCEVSVEDLESSCL